MVVEGFQYLLFLCVRDSFLRLKATIFFKANFLSYNQKVLFNCFLSISITPENVRKSLVF